MTNKRDYFRLDYPINDRPVLESAGRRFAVIEISEKGLKVEVPPDHELQASEAFQGVIQFHNGSQCAVSGTVLRVLKHRTVVIALDVGVPLGKMWDEERRIRATYVRPD